MSNIHAQKIGALGGSKNTKEQANARMNNLKKANAKRISKNAKRLNQRKKKYQESLKKAWDWKDKSK